VRLEDREIYVRKTFIILAQNEILQDYKTREDRKRKGRYIYVISQRTEVRSMRV
jgi:hypothetical protein